MTPTRRKPTRRKDTRKSIDGIADALFVDGARPEEEPPVEVPSEESAAQESGESSAQKPEEAAVQKPEESFVQEPEESAPQESEEQQPAPDEVEGPTPFKVVPGRRSVKSQGGESKGNGRRLSVFHLVLLVVLAVLIVVEGGFCLMRWAVDDASDMQGTWYVNGSQSTITVTGASIILADDVAYEYSIDEGAKTISFAFGTMEGQGRYRFSLDRTQLAIMDGEYTFMDTLTDDIAWTFEALLAQIKGEPLDPGAGDSVTSLSRAAALPPSGDEQPDGSAVSDSSGKTDGSDASDGEGQQGSDDPAQQGAGDGVAENGSAESDATEDGAAGEGGPDGSPSGEEPSEGEASDQSSDSGSSGGGTKFAGEVSDVPLVNVGGHPLPMPKI